MSMWRDNNSLIICWIEYVVKDRYGNHRYSGKQRCHSFVINFPRVLEVLMRVYNYHAKIIKIMRQAGDYRWFPYLYNEDRPLMFAACGTDDTRCGIIIGSGTKEVDPSDYCLEAIYSTTEFEYSGTSVSLNITSSAGYINISRTFTNKTSETKAITEIGLALLARTEEGEFGYLIARDLLDPAVSVDPNWSVTFTYIIEIPF